jgi:hypothetical protein
MWPFIVPMVLCVHFNGLWPHLVDLHKWILDSWKPEIKEEDFIYPYAKGFFIVEFDLAEDMDLILNSGPWFWGNSRLCMKPWTPSLIQ